MPGRKFDTAIADYRQAARNLRGVVDDLEAERKTVLRKWDGEAAEAFKSKSLAFEQALNGEAEDMDTIATLLDEAAEACATAERLMVDLIVEIIEGIIASAATTAIISLITAGIGAIVGPLITAANVAHKAMKAAKITANLADKLSDIDRRLKLLHKMDKAGKEIKRFGSLGKDGCKKGIARYKGKLKDEHGNPIPAGGDRADLVEGRLYQAAKFVTTKEVVNPALGVEKGAHVKEAYGEYAPSDFPGATPDRPTSYDGRPEIRGFDERMRAAESSAQQKVREDFG